MLIIIWPLIGFMLLFYDALIQGDWRGMGEPKFGGGMLLVVVLFTILSFFAGPFMFFSVLSTWQTNYDMTGIPWHKQNWHMSIIYEKALRANKKKRAKLRRKHSVSLSYTVTCGDQQKEFVELFEPLVSWKSHEKGWHIEEMSKDRLKQLILNKLKAKGVEWDDDTLIPYLRVDKIVFD